MNGEHLWSEVAAWLAGRSERTIETSCAQVFLAGERAWKIKKPIRLPFLDFATLERRKWALDRELAFNRRWAADIYRAVRPITRTAEGFDLDGDGETVEWLLEMRRFDPEAVVAQRPESVDGESLGRLIARGHIAAPIDPDGGGVGALGFTIDANEVSLRAMAARFGEESIQRLFEATRAGLGALSPLLEARRAEGFARHCHGDLHLGNILLEDGRPVLFDCIEFNDRLSRIDVLYDAAFPIMDLVVLGRPDAANRLLNAYLDEAARGFPASLWEGLRALPLFMSVRAAVRAHVTAATGADAGPYLAAAQSLLASPEPGMIAVGGLSGTGKSTLARKIAPLVQGATGAVILRSDEIRKRLWPAAAHDRLPSSAYASDMDERVYGEMQSLAEAILGAGRSVVLDATFLAPETRLRAMETAERCHVPFQGVWLEGEAHALRARVTGRTGDASDAGVATLERQLTRDVGGVTWRRVQGPSNLDGLAKQLALPPGT